MTPQELFSTQHRLWFASVFSGRVKRASRIDPYATSARDSTAFYTRLLSVEAGSVVDGQVLTDLGPAGLLERLNGTIVLTAFGRAMLRDWRRLGIATADPQYELALATAMVRGGLDAEIPLFRQLFARWGRLVGLQPASYWLENKWRLTVPEYLDQEDPSGFNPFAIIAVTNQGQVGEQSEWEAWRDADTAMSAPISEMISKVDNRRGRMEFCRAMELVRLSEQSPEAMVSTVAAW